MGKILYFPKIKQKPANKKTLTAIEKLALRFQDNSNFMERLKYCWLTEQPEPYMYGDVANKIYSKSKHQLNIHGFWNNPMPVPSKVSLKSIGGTLGKNLHLGDADPCAYLDRKYKITLNCIKEHKGKSLIINTSSDLIAHSDYMEALDLNNHIVRIHYISTDDRVNKLIEPGAPSFLRRIKAFNKLKKHGVKVELVHIKFTTLDYKVNSRLFLINDGGNYQTNSVGIKLNNYAINEFKKIIDESVLNFIKEA